MHRYRDLFVSRSGMNINDHGLSAERFIKRTEKSKVLLTKEESIEKSALWSAAASPSAAGDQRGMHKK